MNVRLDFPDEPVKLGRNQIFLVGGVDVRRTMFYVAVLVVMALILPIALCAEWPPEEEWRPMSPKQFLDTLRQRLGESNVVPLLRGSTDVNNPRERWLPADTAFCLYHTWGMAPTSEAYLLKDGTPITPSYVVSDQTDAAYCTYTVTMDDELLKPTSTCTFFGEWVRAGDPAYPGETIIVRRAMWHFYLIEFPDGLSEGDYTIHLHEEPVGIVRWAEDEWLTALDLWTALHVG